MPSWQCLFQKTAAMLQDHYLKIKRYANAVATMNQVSTQGRATSVMGQCESLRARFRNTGVGEQYSEVPARNADGTNSSNTVGIVPVELVGANTEMCAQAQTYDHVNAAQLPFPLPNGKQGTRKDKCASAVGRNEAGLTKTLMHLQIWKPIAQFQSRIECQATRSHITTELVIQESRHYYRDGGPRKPPQQKRKLR
jgi:hypothetical protein